MIWIIILIITLTIGILYFANKKTRNYIQNNYSELIVSLAIVILSVFIGSYLALKNTVDTNKEIIITNYRSMLSACEQLEKQYMENTNEIIDSLNSNSKNLSKLNRLVSNMDNPFLLEELLRRSDLYNCASADFKNWLPTNISFFQTTDWTITLNNKEIYRFNYKYLKYIYDLIGNEKKFVDNDLDEESLKISNSILRKVLYDSTYNIPTNHIEIEHIKVYLGDSVNLEEKYWKNNTFNQDKNLIIK